MVMFADLIDTTRETYFRILVDLENNRLFIVTLADVGVYVKEVADKIVPTGKYLMKMLWL